MVKKFSLADLPEVIPIFPLPEALLLPRSRLPLNIFEPRYLMMLEDALKTPERLVGMIQPRHSAGQDQGSLYDIGCAGRIVSMNETEDGRYLISLGGVSRFRIREIQTGFTPYHRALVDWQSFEPDLSRKDSDEGFDRPAFLAKLKRYFEAANLSSDWDSLEKSDEELIVNSLSVLCPFEAEEKQALLEAPDLRRRREILLALMDFAICRVGEDEPIQ